jgi:hypothetical protein
MPLDEPEEKYIFDEKTGKMVMARAETGADRAAAIASMVYLLAMLGVFFWQLFDIWVGRYTLATWSGYGDRLATLNDPVFRLISYAIVGGGLGGVVNGIRSLLAWHVEWGAFEQRYLWKYITVPWLGATLAVIVFALVRSGVAVVGGDALPQDGDLRQSMSTLILGILSGYGAREVFIWLDAQVSRMFKVTPPAERPAPDLVGLTRDEAEKLLTTGSLRLGAVAEEAVSNGEDAGRVIRQEPAPQQLVLTGSAVDVTVGRYLQGDGFGGGGDAR